MEKYTKTFLSVEEQVGILKTRGLLIDNIKEATEVLNVISYFRLADYWRHMEVEHVTHKFKANSSFENILYCYYFDKELRLLLFSEIQEIEVAIRSKIIKHFTPNYGPFWFMNVDCAKNKIHFQSNLSIIRKDVERSHDTFIIEHFQKYSFPDLPPIWKTIEVVTFGTISKIFTNFIDSNKKHNVAREFGLNHYKFLKSWLESIAILRNCCAHHARVWNRTYPIQLKMPSKMFNPWINNFSFRQQSLYPQLCCIAYLINAIYPKNTFVADLKKLFAKYSFINLHLIGFPQNWEEEPLWKE